MPPKHLVHAIKLHPFLGHLARVVSHILSQRLMTLEVGFCSHKGRRNLDW